MSVNPKTGTLKRLQRSTETLPSDDRPSKKAREVGKFNHQALEIEFNDPFNPLVTKNYVGDDNSASGSTLQERPNEIPPEPSQLSRQSMDTLQQIFPTRKNVLRHWKSSGGLAPIKQISNDLMRPPRRKSISRDSSPDELDLFREEAKGLSQHRGHEGIGFAGRESYPRLLPRVNQDLKQNKSTNGLSTTYNASIYDSTVSRDARVQLPRLRGASPSSSYSHNVTPHISTEDLLRGYVLGSEYGPKGLEKLEVGKKQASIVDANEADIPSFNNQFPNSLDDDFAGLPADIEVVREALPKDLGEEAGVELDHGKIEIADMFEEFGLPLSPDRIPRGKDSKGGKVGYHTASTVTRETLEEHGSWEFEDRPRWDHLYVDKVKETLDSGNVYVPIELTGDLVDIKVSPHDATTTDNSLDAELHSKIELFLDGRKDRIENIRGQLYLADDIATDEVLDDRVERALLMPVIYKTILDQHEQDMQIEKRNLDVQLKLDPKGQSLPNSSPLRQSETPSPEKLTSEDVQERGNKEPSIAEQFIQQCNLEPNLEDALKFQKHLKGQEAEYARCASHQRLCEKTGTVDERRRLKRSGESITLSTIKYVSREIIEERDKKRRAGNAMVNEYATDQNFGAVERVLRWADFKPLQTTDHSVEFSAEKSKGKKDDKESTLSEVEVETPLVKGLFWGHKHLKESANKALRLLNCLHLFGTSPKADYAARLSGEIWKVWGPLLAVCLFSGECKPWDNFSTTQTEAQLAMNSVAGLIMIVIMHLSTRKTPNQKLLPWMFLYAFVYTEKGIMIYAHFPKLVVAAEGKPRWKFVSWRVSDDYRFMWTVVYLMRSHTEFVLEQLLAWSQKLPDSAASIMKALIARADAEMKVYQKVLRKLHTGVAKRIEA